MTKPSTISEFAREIHDTLEERGWCTGMHQKKDGKVCLMGAANIVAYGAAYPWPEGEAPEDEPDDEYDFVNPALSSLIKGFQTADINPEWFKSPHIDRAEVLYAWNDSKTASEVKEGLLAIVGNPECAELPCDLSVPEDAPAPRTEADW